MKSVSSLRIKLMLASIIALLAVRDAAAQTLEKIELAGTKPEPRSGHALANAGGKVFLFGGLGIVISTSDIRPAGDFFPQGANFFNDFWQFNKEARQFVKKDPQPEGQTPGAFSSAVPAKDGRILNFFGVTPDGFNDNDREYDPVDNTWLDLPFRGDKAPPRRESPAVIRKGNDIFVFGGRGEDGKVLNDAWKYDPVLKEWIELAPMPTGLFGGWATEGDFDNEIAVQGSSEDPQDFSLLFYKVDTNTWENQSLINSKPGEIIAQADGTGGELLMRVLPAYVEVGNTLYLFGGRGKNFQQLDDIVKVVFKEDRTFTAERLDVRFPGGLVESRAAVLSLTPVAGFEAASLQTVEILIFGGISGGQDTNDTFIFTDTVEVALPPPDECTDGPEVTSVSVSSKLKIKGKGFIEGLFITINGVGFEKSPSVANKKVVQKGKLTNGQSASDVCASGCELKITNGDGKCTKVSAP